MVMLFLINIKAYWTGTASPVIASALQYRKSIYVQFYIMTFIEFQKIAYMFTSPVE